MPPNGEPREEESPDSEGPKRANVSKVARLIAEYDLDGMGERLERHWLGEDGDRSSLRELADLFNRALLEAVMEEAGIQFLDGEVENLYRLLTDPDVSTGQRVRARNILTGDGVDVDRLEENFVSHQSVHNYLRNHRGVSLEDAPDPNTRLDEEAKTIRRLRNRLVVVTESAIDRLRTSGHVDIGDFSVIVDVTVLCDDCGRSFSVRELLQEDSCQCE